MDVVERWRLWGGGGGEMTNSYYGVQLVYCAMFMPTISDYPMILHSLFFLLCSCLLYPMMLHCFYIRILFFRSRPRLNILIFLLHDFRLKIFLILFLNYSF